MSKLTAKFIESISVESISGTKFFTDGNRLQLKVKRTGSGQLSKVWLFRYSFNKVRSFIGLGPYSKSNSL
ncbi:MAG: Arm DNA-binding domain-containing protein, partial [Burkholderiales bacterium]